MPATTPAEREKNAEQPAGKRAEDRLHDANPPGIVANEQLDDCQKVGVERRLVENAFADPVARGDLPRPGVVGQRIGDGMVKKNDGARLLRVDEPNDQAQRENGGEEQRIDDLKCRGRASLALDHAQAGSGMSCATITCRRSAGQRRTKCARL